jgi:hypothetical protein
MSALEHQEVIFKGSETMLTTKEEKDQIDARK